MGYAGAAQPQGGGGAEQVHHRGHVRQGCAGHAGPKIAARWAHNEIVKAYVLI